MPARDAPRDDTQDRGAQAPTFLSQDGERVRITLERKGTHALVKLETHGFSCTLPASAFVLERIAHKLTGQVVLPFIDGTPYKY